MPVPVGTWLTDNILSDMSNTKTAEDAKTLTAGSTIKSLTKLSSPEASGVQFFKLLHHSFKEGISLCNFAHIGLLFLFSLPSAASVGRAAALSQEGSHQQLAEMPVLIKVFILKCCSDTGKGEKCHT